MNKYVIAAITFLVLVYAALVWTISQIDWNEAANEVGGVIGEFKKGYDEKAQGE